MKPSTKGKKNVDVNSDTGDRNSLAIDHDESSPAGLNLCKCKCWLVHLTLSVLGSRAIGQTPNGQCICLFAWTAFASVGGRASNQVKTWSIWPQGSWYRLDA
jgi:hypothetical protein